MNLRWLDLRLRHDSSADLMHSRLTINTKQFEDCGTTLRTLTALFLAWALMMFSIRVWTKFKTRTWGLDDYVMVLAVVGG